MSIFAARYTLNANTATLIVPSWPMSQEVHVHNHDHGGNDDVYIGGASLGTALNGMHIPDTETVALTLLPGEALYAISNNGTPEVQVLVSRL